MHTSSANESPSPSDHSGAVWNAICRSQAVAEFAPDGVIISANDTFLKPMGYERARLVGRNHRVLCDPDYADSRSYRLFWATLLAGDFDIG